MSDLVPTQPETSNPGPDASLSLMGRLFGVPLLIVVCIVSSVTLVVTAFGWIAMEQERSIEALLATLEGGGGQKNAFGMLAPRDKEYWQAAQELANRLKRPDDELPPEARPAVAARLAAMIAKLDTTSLSVQGRTTFQFLVLALAGLDEGVGIDVLVERLTDDDPGIRRMALQGLAEMRHTENIDRAVPAVARLARDSVKEVQMVACNALGNIARPGQPAAIEALTGALAADQEVVWNAALALGFLGSDKALVQLTSMLDRSTWEERITVRYSTPQGLIERPMTPIEIRGYLKAAMDSASRLDDPRLRDLIDELQEDKDHEIREHARKLIAAQPPAA